MKKAIIYTSTILLAVNLILGSIISHYEWMNVAMSCCVIALTMILSLFALRDVIKDGFKVSLVVLFSIIGLVEFLMCVFMPARFTDNFSLIALLVLLGLEALSLVTADVASKKIK